MRLNPDIHQQAECRRAGAGIRAQPRYIGHFEHATPPLPNSQAKRKDAHSHRDFDTPVVVLFTGAECWVLLCSDKVDVYMVRRYKGIKQSSESQTHMRTYV